MTLSCAYQPTETVPTSLTDSRLNQISRVILSNSLKPNENDPLKGDYAKAKDFSGKGTPRR